MLDRAADRQNLKICVGIATSGRRDVLSAMLVELQKQSRRADKILVAPAKDDDVDLDVVSSLDGRCDVLSGPPGLTTQRNLILRAASAMDIVVFFDDDFFPCHDYLERCEAEFAARPDMAVLTGYVFHDAVHTPGLSVEDARTLIEADKRGEDEVMATYNAYGCNMAVRMEVIGRAGVYFDEMLPLYGWLEDVDFSRRMAAHGEILKITGCRGVHLATKRGKGSGIKLGYSQLANPCYMVSKGTMSLDRALMQMTRNVLANIARVLHPEPWVDRRGRLYGNILALRDLMRGEVDPRRILML